MKMVSAAKLRRAQERVDCGAALRERCSARCWRTWRRRWPGTTARRAPAAGRRAGRTHAAGGGHGGPRAGRRVQLEPDPAAQQFFAASTAKRRSTVRGRARAAITSASAARTSPSEHVACGEAPTYGDAAEIAGQVIEAVRAATRSTRSTCFSTNSRACMAQS